MVHISVIDENGYSNSCVKSDLFRCRHTPNKPLRHWDLAARIFCSALAVFELQGLDAPHQLLEHTVVWRVFEDLLKLHN